jgi:hypothetical protein
MTRQNYDARDFVGGTFIKKEDLAAGPQRFTIQGVSKTTFEAKNGQPAEDVLQLELDERQFSLNKTNIKILIGAHGGKTDGWIGKSVILYIDPNVMFGGRLVGGVRVQIPDQTGEEALAADIEEAMADAMADSA